MRSLLMTAVLAGVATLAGCGGGSDNGPAEKVPASASRSSEGLVDYLLGLFETDADRREPVSIDKFEGPTPETTEPEDLT